MSDTKPFTLEEAELHFARALNGQVWELLQKPGRAKAESERMLYAAYASCYHWLKAGTGVNHQRGEWLISHVCAELGLAEPALRHAARCEELTAEFADLMKDFDRAYAHEGMARAHALAGNRDAALSHLRLAEEAGQAIADPDGKSTFLGDLSSGAWHGIR